MLRSEDRQAMINEYRVLLIQSGNEGEQYGLRIPRARALQVGVLYTKKRRLKIVRL